MAKILREHEIPGGKYCRLTNGMNLEMECPFLLDGEYCTIFGSKPSHIWNGHVVGVLRLNWCKVAEDKAKRFNDLLNQNQGQTGPRPQDGPAAKE